VDPGSFHELDELARNRVRHDFGNGPGQATAIRRRDRIRHHDGRQVSVRVSQDFTVFGELTRRVGVSARRLRSWIKR